MEKEKIFLIKDTKSLSREVEEYLIKNHYEYDFLFGDSGPNKPLIFVPGRTIPYEGAGGFSRFKERYPPRELSSNGVHVN